MVAVCATGFTLRAGEYIATFNPTTLTFLQNLITFIFYFITKIS